MKLIRSTVVGKSALLLACVASLGASGDNAPYIQSDGANTVNLGYFASKKTKIEVDFQFVELVKNYDTVFGYYGNDNTFLLYAPLNDSLAGTFKFSAKDGGYSGLELSPRVSIDLARHKAVIDMPNRHVAMYAADGSLQGEADFPSAWTIDNTSDWPVILFGSCTDAHGSARYGRCAKVRIYGTKIYETDNGQQSLVHDLVPCLKGENAGLYDNATTTFFGGHGSSGELVAGGEGIMTIPEDGYVESPSDNYASKHLTFNTGYYMKSNSWLAVDYQWLGTPKDLLFGAWDAGAKLSTAFWINSGFAFLYKADGGYATYPSIAKDNYRHTAIIDARDGSFRLLNRSGFVQWSGTSGTNGINNAAWPIVLFGAASDSAGTGKQWTYARIFSAKFYEGDNPNPVKEFVPFSNHGVVGFKEMVSGTFYPATGMSGGGAIASEGRADAYVESTGSTCLNLGYKANMKSRIEVDFLSLGSYGKCLCGAWSAGNIRYTFWNSNVSGHAGKWSFIFHGKNSADPQYVTDLDEDRERHTVVMDMKNLRLSVVTGGVTNWTRSATADTFNASDESSCPMGIFGNISNVDGTTYSMQGKACIYSVRIYEDDVLKHQFLPCKDGATVSLYDTVDKSC
ncbi:MAG: hypothetical protein J6V72_07250, partial [Kiritimatiellae bacterium]|nr:hypothetical protein [Kiritimatiellia bacterium]